MLIGLPWAQSLNRSPTNARTDLMLIVDQLLSLSDSKSQVPPIRIFLDNAESYVPGTELAKLIQETSKVLAGKRGGK